jgi:hypothetical protein
MRSRWIDRWFGGLALPEDALALTREGLTSTDAATMLTPGELLGSPKTIDETVDEIKSSIMGKKYIKALQAMVEEVGKDGLNNMAEDILLQYRTTLHTLGIRPLPEDRSMSWVFENLAKRRYLSEHPDEIDANGSEKGLEINNPAGSSAAAILTRRNIVDRRVGQAYAFDSIHTARAATKATVEIPPHEREPGGDEFREVNVYQETVTLDKRHTDLLQAPIRDEVVAILKQAETSRLYPKGKDLSNEDFVRLGELLGGSVKERLSVNSR